MAGTQAGLQLLGVWWDGEIGAARVDLAGVINDVGAVDLGKLLDRFRQADIKDAAFVFVQSSERIDNELLAIVLDRVVLAHHEDGPHGFAFPTLVSQFRGQRNHPAKDFEVDLVGNAIIQNTGLVIEITRDIGNGDTVGHNLEFESGKRDDDIAIGQDLVGMLVDDVVVCGAEPLFVTDYIACGKVVPERIAAIVSGVADGCRLAGAALIGGETAEHPGLLGEDEYDMAGAVTGVVEADDVLGAHRVLDGDAVVAMASSGLHSNGYSLARHTFFDVAGWSLDRHVPDLGRTLGEEMLEPTRIYARDCLAVADGVDVHAMSHITGGGLAANIDRVLPDDMGAVLDRSTWTLPPVFTVLGELGVAADELERTFNVGVGMAVVLPESDVAAALEILQHRGVPAWRLGTITAGERTRVVGSHPG